MLSLLITALCNGLQDVNDPQPASDAAIVRRYIGKPVWLFGATLEAEIARPGTSTAYFDVPHDLPLIVASIRRLGHPGCVGPRGGPFPEDMIGSMTYPNPLVVEFNAPRAGRITGTASDADSTLLNTTQKDLRRYEVVVGDWKQFDLLIHLQNPLTENVPKRFRRAIHRGIVLKGMTRQMVMLVKGPPKWNGTTIERAYNRDVWDFAAGGFAQYSIDMVEFKNGKVVRIEDRMIGP